MFLWSIIILIIFYLQAPKLRVMCSRDTNDDKHMVGVDFFHNPTLASKASFNKNLNIVYDPNDADQTKTNKTP